MSEQGRFVETGDETDEERAQLKQTRVKAKTIAELRADAWTATMATLEGRRVAWDILDQLGLSRHIIAADVQQTYANAGKQHAAIELLTRLKTLHPAETRLMQQENDL